MSYAECKAKGHEPEPIALFHGASPGYLCHRCHPNGEWSTMTRLEFRLAFGKTFGQFCREDLGIHGERLGSVRARSGVDWISMSGRGSGRASGSSADRRRSRREAERATALEVLV